MIPLFKTSNGSIGKSILTLDDPEKQLEGGPDSVFSIAKENNLNKIVFVEDTMAGLPKVEKYCKKNNIQFVYGLRISIRNSEKEEDASSEHKVIVFGKNTEGAKTLNKVYSCVHAFSNGFITYDKLAEIWNADLFLAIPFYDSFLFVNNMSFSSIVPNFTFTNPIFFVENNSLPFDFMIEQKVKEFCSKNGYRVFNAKTIYYKNRSDVTAFMTYKMICNSKFSKEQSLDKPNLEHFASNEFCFESWKENHGN